MTQVSIQPFTQAHLDGLIALVAADGWTEYYERLGASRSLGFRLTREALGLRGTAGG
jgi:hypothetical protein